MARRRGQLVSDTTETTTTAVTALPSEGSFDEGVAQGLSARARREGVSLAKKRPRMTPPTAAATTEPAPTTFAPARPSGGAPAARLTRPWRTGPYQRRQVSAAPRGLRSQQDAGPFPTSERAQHSQHHECVYMSQHRPGPRHPTPRTAPRRPPHDPERRAQIRLDKHLRTAGCRSSPRSATAACKACCWCAATG